MLARLLWLLPLSLVGCLLPAPEKTGTLDAPVPAAYSEPAVEAVITQNWLAVFADPALEAIVARALDDSFSLAAAAARLEQANALARINGADRLPALNLTGSASDNQTVQGNPPVDIRSDNFDVRLSASWELDLWGRVRAGAAAATADAEAARADFDGARLSLAAQVAQRWYEAIAAAQQAALSAETVVSRETNLQTVTERFERGLSSALDLRLTRANVATARANLATQRRLADAAVRRLQVLVGEYPDGRLALAENLPLPVEPPPVGLPATLVQRRPDLQAAERRLVAADFRLSESEARRLPAISLSANYGRNTSDLDDLADSAFDVWSLAGNLTAPLFQGGRISAGIDQADARLREAAANYAEAALNAFREVETGLTAEAFLRDRLDALEVAAEESGGAEDLAEERYARGLEDIITVLESQQRTFDARINAIVVRNELLQNRIDLYLALGGEF